MWGSSRILNIRDTHLSINFTSEQTGLLIKDRRYPLIISLDLNISLIVL